MSPSTLVSLSDAVVPAGSRRLTIGMPVYNASRYLPEAFDSLLAQEFENFDLVISDNASTDGTRDIIRAYCDRDARIRPVFQAENIGPARNDNFVLSQAPTPLFKWAAHDDIYSPLFLGSCIQALDSDATVALAYTKTWIIDANGEVVSPYEDNFHLVSPYPHIRLKDYLRAMALLNPFYGVIRTEVLNNVLPLASYASADKVLLGEMALHGKFHEVPERLFYRRIHETKSTVANTTDEQWDSYYNPSAENKSATPRLRRFLDHARTVNHAPMSIPERMNCFRVLLQFYFSTNRVPGVVKDFQSMRRRYFHPGSRSR